MSTREIEFVTKIATEFPNAKYGRRTVYNYNWYGVSVEDFVAYVKVYGSVIEYKVYFTQQGREIGVFFNT